MAKQMTPLQSRISPLLKLKLVREVILLVPTLSGRRTSNKTEDYGVFKPSRLSHLERVLIYVADLERSCEWYERLIGAICTHQSGSLPHPTMPGQTIRSATLSLPEQQGSIVLIQRVEANGKVVPVSHNSHFHFALELPHGRTSFEMAARLREMGARIVYGPVKHNSEPGGDGESGGNVAVYTYDPDGHQSSASTTWIRSRTTGSATASAKSASDNGDHHPW
jgi:catechol 2,3-dioxygenase-like lactoylglutathione lyase family enzyme